LRVRELELAGRNLCDAAERRPIAQRQRRIGGRQNAEHCADTVRKVGLERAVGLLVAPVRRVAVGSGTLTLTMLLVLGMPLTSTVASAYPGGKFHTGKEVNEFVDQFVVSRNVVCSLSMLRNWTRG